jgi:hypothetical protein
MGSGQLRAPRLSLNKNIINDQQAAIDVLSVRGTGAGQDGIELAETLELIEGAGGLRGSGELKALRRSVQKTQEEALRSTNLNQRALENQAALNNLSSVSPGTAPVDNLLRQSIRDLSAESTQLTRENILLKMQSHPAARNNSITIPQDFGTRVDGILSSTQGKELLEAQKLLDDSFREYQGKLTAGLNNSLQKLAPGQSKDLAKAVEKATKPRGGVLGIGATEVAQADKQVITNIQALVEGRANIVTEGGMSLKGHRQASELKRVAKEVIESRDPKAMKELETALANPQFEFSSVQRSSKLHTFLDSRSRNVSLGMDSSQARKLHEMVGLEGRGTGDIAKQTTEFFSTKALNSPNSPAGAELSSVMNGLGDEGAQLLRMGREGGPAGNSAFGKIMSGDPAMARAEAYTKAELEALVSDKQVLKDSIDKARNLAPGHEALFDQYISSNKPIGDSLREIDRNLGKLASKAGPKVQREVARLTEVRAALQGVATDQQAALSTKFDAASRGVTTARDLISKDISIGRLNLPPSVAQGAIAQEAAAQGGAGALGTVATIGGVGGLAGILASRGSSRPATQAKQQVAATASFGLSPLHAPVIHNKLAASVKAIPLKNTQPKLPDPMKIPAQSLLTSTPQAREQAMKMSSLLAAPIRAY